MNHDAPQPSFELPAPLGGDTEASTLPHEQDSLSPEQSVQPPSATPDPMAVPLPGAQWQQLPAQPVTQQTARPTSPASPAVADDQDLIEKEWVVKAKQIITATREDPNAQSRELSRFKADYLKKRYNKDIKTEES